MSKERNQERNQERSQGKQEQIVSMFDSIASSYDRANRVLSLGIDVRWRKEACVRAFEALGRDEIGRILDVACGTGDMMSHWHAQAGACGKRIVESIGIDPSSGMLEVAREKLSPLIESGALRLIKGEAAELQLESESVDILSIAYGLRNVVELDGALDEFARVLRRGGIVVILEFMNNAQGGLLDRLMRFYTRKILPLVGGLISRNYAAYKYLPDSIDGFVSAEELSQRLSARGVECYLIKGYSANISTLYVGVKA